MRALISILCGVALAVTSASTTRACTTFCYADGGTLVFGRNYDWNVDDGLVLINKRGVSKRAMVKRSPARWTSRFGSITFNQYGREFPTGGMNERGLIVELMWLAESQYPGDDARGALPTLQWIQYQLDNSTTVDDVLKSDRDVRIADGGSAKIHFLIADANGDVATVEFLNGKLVAHRGKELPYPVLTNDTYEHSVEFARAHANDPGSARRGSLERFARAANYKPKAKTPADAVLNAFTTLENVSQGEHTKWSIVYDIRDRRVYFRTYVARNVRWIDLDGLAFDCQSAVTMLDVNARLAGDVTGELKPYQPLANRRLVNAAFNETEFLRDVPTEERDELAQYPESTTCASKSAESGGK